ncbi:MAG: hypothetical protein B7Y02_12620 [Rhodobacterales bacterium 17-64-5]|nr:MAG: hypothetical protein B7Y02_12620 [Rhodobacterales bacterium 17-64-5]
MAATKSLGEKIKVTAGLGWGRFGSYESIGSPFGDRPEAGTVGRPNVDQWFKGDAAVFGGVEVKVTDTLTVKGEYSSDAYTLEDDERGIIDRASPFNFGLEYQKGPNARYGLYYVHGTEIGFALHLILDPKTLVTGGVMGAAPMPVKLRPTRSADPEAYDGGWVTQPDAAPLLQNNLAKRLAVDGIVIDSLSYTATTVQIRIRNNRIDAGSQAIGRTARALTHVMPASVEVFEIVPVVNGIGASKVTIRRSDLEELEYVADNSTLLRERVTVTDAGKAPASAITDSDPYPDFSWGLKPALRVPQPAQAEVGARLSANYILRPGLVLKGSIYGRLFGNVDYSGDASGSTLQPVRSDGARYAKFGNPALEELTLAWYARPAADVYSRFTVGYLERMHAGVSGEILWKRVDNPLALGVELNYTLQRDTDGFFGVGPGFRIINQPNVAWRVQAGFGVSYLEDGLGDDETEEGYVASSRFYYEFSEGMYLTNDTDVLSSDTALRANNDLSVNFRVTDAISTRISYFTDYNDSRDIETDNRLGVSLVVGF